MYGVLNIKDDRHIHRKRGYRRQRELRLRHGGLYRRRIGVQINARFQPCRGSPHHILGKIRIETALRASHPDKGEAVPLRSYSAPVDRFLIHGNVDSLCNHSRRLRLHTGAEQRSDADQCRENQTGHSHLPVFSHTFPYLSEAEHSAHTSVPLSACFLRDFPVFISSGSLFKYEVSCGIFL